MNKARRLYAAEPSGLAGFESIYALDASIIDLSLALCPWANWTGHDAAVKLHALLDLRGSIPYRRAAASDWFWRGNGPSRLKSLSSSTAGSRIR